METYEKIVSQKLDNDDFKPGELEKEKNLVEQKDENMRRLQMEKIVIAAQTKTEKERIIKQNIGSVMQGALTLKDVISFAVQTVPQAALAWSGVCLALQVCLLMIFQSLS